MATTPYRPQRDERVDDVALGFGHLAPVAEEQPAVAVHLLGQRQIKRHEHGRPDDGVEAHNLLADEMNVGRPVFAVIGIVVRTVAQRGDVVGERVEPDVDDVFLVQNRTGTPR